LFYGYIKIKKKLFISYSKIINNCSADLRKGIKIELEKFVDSEKNDVKKLSLQLIQKL